jgi:hypothetical protein
MAFWAFIECRQCGFTGCAAPIDDLCPRCCRPLTEPEESQPPES